MNNTLQDLQRIDTGALKKFAQSARRKLREQVAAQLDRVIKNDSAELREKEAAIKQLKNQIATSSREAVIERVAYVWFNRFCALRFMDVNQYTRMGTVSPAEGFTQPEILAEAKQGHIDESLKPFITEQRVFDLLSGRISSKDPQQEAYRLLIVAVCNYYNSIMPFLFEKISDYTELLMPDDLLSDSSILADTRNTLSTEACRDVEVIGWLYQFYISEKKDEVFEDLKKNKKIAPENIPAATQLFTPRWIVRYVVENSLGRLWMLNRPKSRLIDRMDFYIQPEQDESDFIGVDKPEELKICDPAAGSGHMLVYAFDLLYTIYEEEGYEPTDIPRLILENNLYGIEIDERAGELAAFALVMKAREKYRRFLTKPIQPNIIVLENFKFDQAELSEYFGAVVSGEPEYSDLLETLQQFQYFDTFGSLVRPHSSNLQAKMPLAAPSNLFLQNTHEKVSKALNYVTHLSRQYHVVIANPPYMGAKNMDQRLRDFAQQKYPSTKADLFAMFIERILELTAPGGFVGLMTPFTWMFISTYEQIRSRLISEVTLTNLVRPEYHAFFESAYVPICAFTLFKRQTRRYFGCFIDLSQFYGAEIQAPKLQEAIRDPNCTWRYSACSASFNDIPGAPIAYWVNDRIRQIFKEYPALEQVAMPKQGSTIGDNDKFLRLWYEIPLESRSKWVGAIKGGSFRRWYGNHLYVVNWHADGAAIKSSGRATIRNSQYLFKPGIEWSRVTSSTTSFRVLPPGFFHESASGVAFPSPQHQLKLLGLLNSRFVHSLLGILNPTLTFQSGDVARLPFISGDCDAIVEQCVDISQTDWDSFELSQNFHVSPLLEGVVKETKLEEAYANLRQQWLEKTTKMQQLENQNNELFCDLIGLDKSHCPAPPLCDITLTCNPYYRYQSTKSSDQLETLLLADTVKELLSYAVGCMFGRYSLDKPGLILANHGQTKYDYLKLVPNPRFPIDDDNVLPVLDGDWFTDDISERFRRFLRVSFGDDHYQANVQFIENALGKDLRKYFLRDFYPDHIKRYKKRPIYWLFSSPKGTFNALIYMHRYRPDTVSVVLNDYLREFRNKLSARKNHLEAVTVSVNVGPADKAKALKEIESLKKAIEELDTYEREVLYPLATQKIEIDLDDGVKVNYSKFGRALKVIPGMASEED